MNSILRRGVTVVLAIGILISVAVPVKAADAGGADCEAALIKCGFTMFFIVGPLMAAALCLAGYEWCLQFLGQ